MQVGDLVKDKAGLILGFGIITEKKKRLNELFCVVWTFGVEGWFHAHDLEVV